MFRQYSSLSFAIAVIVAFLMTGAKVPDQYMTCQSELFSCGKSISGVGYPFWGDGRPKYCGLPSMQLQCWNLPYYGYTTLLKDTMKAETLYNISKINTSNFTLNIKWIDTNCTSFMKVSDILKFTQNTEVITFLYKCPGYPFQLDYPGIYMCQMGNDVAETYYVPNVTALRNNVSCGSSFEVPVLKSNLELYNKGEIKDITDVIVGGFEAYYEHSEECFKCQNSGGLCGSSEDSGFVCHCKNGESKDMCRIKASSIPSKAFIFGGSAVLISSGDRSVTFRYFLEVTGTRGALAVGVQIKI